MDATVPTMDIYARYGARVVYANAKAGYEPDRVKAREHLELGETYTVAGTNIYRSFTNVYLVEVPGVAFSSALFQDAPKESK